MDAIEILALYTTAGNYKQERISIISHKKELKIAFECTQKMQWNKKILLRFAAL